MTVFNIHSSIWSRRVHMETLFERGCLKSHTALLSPKIDFSPNFSLIVQFSKELSFFQFLTPPHLGKNVFKNFAGAFKLAKVDFCSKFERTLLFIKPFLSYRWRKKNVQDGWMSKYKKYKNNTLCFIYFEKKVYIYKYLTEKKCS